MFDISAKYCRIFAYYYCVLCIENRIKKKRNIISLSVGNWCAVRFDHEFGHLT